MKIRRFASSRNQMVKPKQVSKLPEGAFRVEFFSQSEDGFPVGEWFAAVLFSDHIEYYRIPLSGYQTVNRLISRFSEAVQVDGRVVQELVTSNEVKIMSLTNNSSG